jgi:hypothetical protein
MGTHNNAAYKNNDNDITLKFVGPHKTTQRTLMPHEGSTRNVKTVILKQMHLNEGTIIENSGIFNKLTVA